MHKLATGIWNNVDICVDGTLLGILRPASIIPALTMVGA